MTVVRVETDLLVSGLDSRMADPAADVCRAAASPRWMAPLALLTQGRFLVGGPYRT